MWERRGPASTGPISSRKMKVPLLLDPPIFSYSDDVAEVSKNTHKTLVISIGTLSALVSATGIFEDDGGD